VTKTFNELGVSAPLCKALTARGIKVPFEIQLATIPDAIAGRDICGRAPTGSGKTLAFGIPLISRSTKAQAKKPTALILAPTRELAEQICTELRPIAKEGGRRISSVYGGVSINRQKQDLAKGVDILVACPGRLHDLLRQKALRLDEVNIVVIDEADRMADMGFLPEVKKLLDLTSSNRQTLLFSATLDGDVAILTKNYQENPVRHEIGRKTANVQEMDHNFWSVNRPERVSVASQLILNSGKTMVFTRTRHGADRAAKQLKSAGVDAVSIHGGKSQGQRTRSLESFSKGQALALVATDVAARGIHVSNVACVLHFDPPEDSKTYVHRSGRTARAGATGVVVCFVDQSQHRKVKHMQRELGLDVRINEPDYKPAYIVQDNTDSSYQQKREKVRITEKNYRDRRGDIEDVVTAGSRRRLRNRQDGGEDVSTEGSNRKKGYRNRPGGGEDVSTEGSNRKKGYRNRPGGGENVSTEGSNRKKGYRNRPGGSENVSTEGSHRKKGYRNRSGGGENVSTEGSNRKKGYRNRQGNTQGSSNTGSRRTKSPLSVV